MRYSLVLFNVYSDDDDMLTTDSDDMLIKLSKHGCSMIGDPLCALMYADHLVLLASTKYELHGALLLCAVEMEEIGFKIYCSKSLVIWIERSMDTSCCDIK